MEKDIKIFEKEIKKILNDNYDILVNQVEEINRWTADIIKIIADWFIIDFKKKEYLEKRIDRQWNKYKKKFLDYISDYVTD